jgi:hypothetical protein
LADPFFFNFFPVAAACKLWMEMTCLKKNAKKLITVGHGCHLPIYKNRFGNSAPLKWLNAEGKDYVTAVMKYMCEDISAHVCFTWKF